MLDRLRGSILLLGMMLGLATAAMSAADARSLTAKALYGKWCTAGGSEEFTDDYLIAVLTSKERHRYKISRYSVSDDTITVYWIDGSGAEVSTDFSEFSADGKSMVQIRNESGPRREFRRC